MATRCQPLIPAWLMPGLTTALLLSSVALLALFALCKNAPASDWLSIIQDSYLWHILRFSLWQALLSTHLSVIPAILLARALYRRRFFGRRILLRLCAMTLVLPVLVAIFGILSVYGRSGWLAQLCTLLNIGYSFTPYGLQGILLTHVFFNLPLATRLLLHELEQIPNEQRQLAVQLGLSGFVYFRFVEWPWLRRQIMPIGTLVFILCFASFTTVLALGGGPSTTSIELAIFQALNFDYDPRRAAFLALLQMIFCLSLVLFNRRLNRVMPSDGEKLSGWRNPQDCLCARLIDSGIIVLALLLIIPPFLAVVADGLNPRLRGVLQQPAMWKAMFTSLRIALVAGLVSILLTLMLLWSSRELRLRQYWFFAEMLEMSGMLILAMPSLVLGTGFFLLLNQSENLVQSAESIVILINALMAVPYVMKVLENPLRDVAKRYNCLCLSLNIIGWNRFCLIELRALKCPLVQAFAFACVLSIGDFGVMALFGNGTFRTLPSYLYQQIGSYRSSESAVTALMLLMLCLLLFTLIEKLPGCHVKSD